MPVQVFTSINDLVAYVQAELPTNGNQEITAEQHREVMQSTVLSLASILTALPPELVLDYPAWDSEETYVGAVEVIVRHNNKLWLFVSGTGQTGVEPGNNFTVWQEVSALQVAHLRNADTMLAQGTSNQVTAVELRQSLDAPKYWGKPVLAMYPAPIGGELVGDEYVVAAPAFDDFEGQEAKIATLSGVGWVFSDAVENEVRATREGELLQFKSGNWTLIASDGIRENVASLLLRLNYIPWLPLTHDGLSPLTLNLSQSTCFIIDVTGTVLNLAEPISQNPHEYIFHFKRAGFAPVTATWPASWAGEALPATFEGPLLVRGISVHYGGVNRMHITYVGQLFP